LVGNFEPQKPIVQTDIDFTAKSSEDCQDRQS
jgi:hypothetical protein